MDRQVIGRVNNAVLEVAIIRQKWAGDSNGYSRTEWSSMEGSTLGCSEEGGGWCNWITGDPKMQKLYGGRRRMV